MIGLKGTLRLPFCRDDLFVRISGGTGGVSTELASSESIVLGITDCLSVKINSVGVYNGKLKVEGNIQNSQNGELELPAGFSLLVPENLGLEALLSKEELELKLTKSLSLGLPKSLFVPTNENFEPIADGQVKIELPNDLKIRIDNDLNVTVDNSCQVEIADRFMIGQTGIVLSDIKFSLKNFTKELKIESAILRFPKYFKNTIEIKDASISRNGFTGKIKYLSDGSDPITLFKKKLTITSIEVELQQNRIYECQIGANLNLPFFDSGKTIPITLRLDESGGLTAGLKADSGVVEAEIAGCTLGIEGLEMTVSDSKAEFCIDGYLTLPDELNKAKIRVAGLCIDQDGNIKMSGGWLDIPEPISVGIYGLSMQVSKVGFGKTQSGDKWIGLNGKISFVNGVDLNVDVEGLKISSGNISIEGIGVSLKVPGSFDIKGSLSLKNNEYKGLARIKIVSLDMDFEASLRLGERYGKKYMAVAISAGFPAGLPLFTTGLGIYGLSGLFAYRMEPKKPAGKRWDEWYKNISITDINNWDYSANGLAFGSGAKLATIADNGFSFSSKLFLMILFPGPIILLQGKAGVLGENDNFTAFLTVDTNSGYLLFSLDAKFGYEKLIKISGNLEAFFSKKKWYLHLGKKEPMEKRLSAEIFGGLFSARSYLMIEQSRLMFGSWAGYKKRWKLGPLKLGLEAWLDKNLKVSRKPMQVSGDLSLHGLAYLKAFGRGLELSVDSKLVAEAPKPFSIGGKFKVKLKLPWPIPDIKKTVSLKWGPKGQPPALEDPLKGITAVYKATNYSWPLVKSVVPVVPVVPMDSQFVLSFSKNMTNMTNTDNTSIINSEGEYIEKIGKYAAQYILKSISLEKKTEDDQWKEATCNACGDPNVYGAWDATEGHNSLRIYSSNPFDFTLNTDLSWQKSFSNNVYPPKIRDMYMEKCESLSLLIQPQTKEVPETNLISTEGYESFILLQFSGSVVVFFPSPEFVNAVTLSFRSQGDIKIDARNSAGRSLEVQKNTEDNMTKATICGPVIQYVKISNYYEIYIEEICCNTATCSYLDNLDRIAESQESLIKKWNSLENLLDPFTEYRWVVMTGTKLINDNKEEEYTRHFYFKTEGPPGFINCGETADSYFTKLDGEYLTPIPHNSLSKQGDAEPDGYFYRKYDVEILFREKYPVQDMYVRAKHDLCLLVFDTIGKEFERGLDDEILICDVWGEVHSSTAEVTCWQKNAIIPRDERVSAGDKLFLDMLNSAGYDVEMEYKPQSKLAISKKGKLLKPATIYEARLCPMLARDSLSSEEIKIFEEESRTWTVRLVSKNSLPEDPIYWSDYLVKVTLSFSGEADALLFRYTETSWYLLIIEKSGSLRLVENLKGDIKDETLEGSLENGIYEVRIEAYKTRIRVKVTRQSNSEIVVSCEEDSSIDCGTVGMGETSFSDLRIIDLREKAKTVFSSVFTTSGFADFSHHINSYDGVPEEAVIENSLDGKVICKDIPDSTGNITEEEDNAFQELLWKLPGRFRNSVRCMKVSHVKHSDKCVGFFVQSPEPLDWRRITLNMEHSEQIKVGVRPRNLKITDFWKKDGQVYCCKILALESTELKDNVVGIELDSEFIEIKRWKAKSMILQGYVVECEIKLSEDFCVDNGVFVTLKNSDDEICHKRYFPSSGSFESEEFCVLRRRSDGAQFFVFPKDEIGSGTYRLSFEYSLESTEGEQFSMGGKSTKESASIDILLTKCSQ